MTAAPRPSDEFSRLLADLADHELEEAGAARLVELLRADPSARRIYFEHTMLEFLLGRETRREASVSLLPAGLPFSGAEPAAEECFSKAGFTPLRSLRAGVQFLSQPVHFSVLVASLALVSLLLTTAQISLPFGRAVTRKPARFDEGQPVARVIGSAAARWASGTKRVGSALHRGERLRLQQGQVRLAFATGSQVTLGGPARFRLVGRNRLRLSFGHLAAHVPGSARGFAVETPTATIVDLGTRFGVHVEQNGESEVHVFEGSVRLQPKPRQKGGDPPPAPTVITANQAVRINRLHEIRPIAVRQFAQVDASLQSKTVPVTNGSFEQPATNGRWEVVEMPGWSKLGDAGETSSSPPSQAGRSGVVNATHRKTLSPRAPDGRQWLYLNRGAAVRQCLGPMTPGTTYMLTATLGGNFHLPSHNDYVVSFQAAANPQGPTVELKRLENPPRITPGIRIPVQLVYQPSAETAEKYPLLFIHLATGEEAAQIMVDAVQVTSLAPSPAEDSPSSGRPSVRPTPEPQDERR